MPVHNMEPQHLQGNAFGKVSVVAAWPMWNRVQNLHQDTRTQWSPYCMEPIDASWPPTARTAIVTGERPIATIQ